MQMVILALAMDVMGIDPSLPEVPAGEALYKALRSQRRLQLQQLQEQVQFAAAQTEDLPETQVSTSLPRGENPQISNDQSEALKNSAASVVAEESQMKTQALPSPLTLQHDLAALDDSQASEDDPSTDDSELGKF